MAVDVSKALACQFEPLVVTAERGRLAFLGRLLTNWVPQERLRSWRVRFAAIAPVHAQPTCTGRVLAVTDGLAALELQVALPDGTVTLQATPSSTSPYEAAADQVARHDAVSFPLGVMRRDLLRMTHLSVVR